MLAALLKGEMHPSEASATEEEMASIPILRQYSNRRAKKHEDGPGTSRTTRSSPASEQEKEKGSTSTCKVVGVKNTNTIPSQAVTRKKSVKVFTPDSRQPQVIVRKFTLPTPHTIPIREFSHDFQKPKQRWKQLCNLTQEMTTTLPVAKVKMVHPSELKREVRSGTLRSNTKVDLQAKMTHEIRPGTLTKKADKKTLEKLLTSVNSTETNSNIKTIKTLAPCKGTEKIDVSPLQPTNNTPVPNPSAACKEILPNSVTSPPPSRMVVSATNSRVSSPKIKTLVTSPSNKIPSSSNGSTLSPSSEVVTLCPSTGVISSENENMVRTSPPLPKVIVVKGSKSSPYVQNIASTPSNKMIVTSLTLPVSNKVVDAPERTNSPANSTDDILNIVDEEMVESVPDVAATTEITSDGPGPKCNNFGRVGDKYVIVQHLPGKKFVVQDQSSSKPPTSTKVLKPSPDEKNIPKQNSLSHTEVSGSLLKATLLGTDLARDQSAVAVRTVTYESSNITNSDSSAVLSKPVPNPDPTPSQMECDEDDKLPNTLDLEKTLEDVNTDVLKKPMTLKQLQHEIALLKARQNIALKVERDVLRAKDVKVLREVHIPSRRALLSDIGTQTNLFSLVEPGRMVEMMINSNRNAESSGMVSAKGNFGPGENSTEMQNQTGVLTNRTVSPKSGNPSAGLFEEPDKKRPRLDENNASSRTLVSDTLTTDSSSDILHNYHVKNSNFVALNSKLTEQSKSGQVVINAAGKLKGSLGSSQVIGRVVTKSTESPNTVFDIIVQHNISAQSKRSTGDKSAPMVYIPENNSLNARKFGSAETANIARNNQQQSTPFCPQNVSIQETAARISQLKGEIFKDWSRCLVSDSDGNIPLHIAVLNENLTLVKRQCAVLCARKAALDVPNNDKRTPLHLAVIDSNVEIVKTLLSFGAQPTVKDQDGNTAMHLAIIDGNLECVNVLLNENNARNLPLDDFNDEGYAPLHLCALRGKVEESRLLIAKGAEVNLKDARSGRTPLFHAVESNNGDLVRLLLAMDASTNEPNFAGHTPLMAASEVSFSSGPGMYSEVMNFNSKLVSLKSGQILEDGGNIVIRGDIIEDMNMEEVSDGVGPHYSKSSTSGKSKTLWATGD